MESEKVPELTDLRKSKLVPGERWAGTLAERGSEPAVWLPDGRVARTFTEIEMEAQIWSERLRGLGLEGSVVSLCVPNVPAWPGMLLGIWRAGCAALLVDATLAETQVATAEAGCGAGARIGWDGDGTLSELPGGARLVTEGCLFKLTSGTTGAARALVFTAEAVLADCDQVCETMGIGGGDVNYGVIAFSHSYGFSNLVTPLLFRGVPVVAAADSLPRALWSGIEVTGATVLPAVPAIFRALSGVKSPVGSRLRTCISAGAPLPSRVGSAFRREHGLKVRSFYGASECGGICFDSSDVEDVPDGFVGAPLRGVDVVADGDGGVSVRSAALHAAAGGAFVPGDLLAGDAGSGFRIVGRVSDVV
ncbi:MAG: AMP-binding protein, partial [Chthoniobacterales bacterium]